MNENKQQKADFIIKKLEGLNHYVEVKANGHIRVTGVDFWCTTEKWWDSEFGQKGKGLKSFIEYLDSLQV